MIQKKGRKGFIPSNINIKHTIKKLCIKVFTQKFVLKFFQHNSLQKQPKNKQINHFQTDNLITIITYILIRNTNKITQPISIEIYNHTKFISV